MGTDATRPPWETQWFSQGYRDILNDNGKYTWDIPYLNQYEGHYVFVYGTLRRGGSNHLVLSGNTKNVFGGVAVTSSARWDMWVADTGAGKPRFPVMLYSGDKSRWAKVKGELWYVPTETILKMDRLEANGTLYERTMEGVWVGNEKVNAFVYEGMPSFWKDKATFNSPLMKQNGASYHYFHQGMANTLKG